MSIFMGRDKFDKNLIGIILLKVFVKNIGVSFKYDYFARSVKLNLTGICLSPILT